MSYKEEFIRELEKIALFVEEKRRKKEAVASGKEE